MADLTRYPILTRAHVIAAVGAVVLVLKHYGVVIPDAEVNSVVDLVTVGGPLALAVWAARHTTPVADPKTTQLVPLVPAPAAPVKASAEPMVLVPASSVAAPVAAPAPAPFLPPLSAPTDATATAILPVVPAQAPAPTVAVTSAPPQGVEWTPAQ